MTRDYYVAEENSQRKIICAADNKGIRILTKEAFANMSDGSLKGYKKKVIDHHAEIHQHGTIQAIKAIDYLRHTINRELGEREAEKFAQGEF